MFGDAGFGLFGVVGAETGEDVQGMLPVLTGLVVPVEGVVWWAWARPS